MDTGRRHRAGVEVEAQLEEGERVTGVRVGGRRNGGRKRLGGEEARDEDEPEKASQNEDQEKYVAACHNQRALNVSGRVDHETRKSVTWAKGGRRTSRELAELWARMITPRPG